MGCATPKRRGQTQLRRKTIQKYAAAKARNHAELMVVKLVMKALLFMEPESLISCMRYLLY